MPVYLTRVSISCRFVREKMENNVDPVMRLKNAIPAKYEAELARNRYTFGLFKLKADSQTECKKAVTEAWTDIFPDDADAIRVLIFKEDDTDVTKLMTSIFTCYYGADAYVEMISELTASLPLIKERGALRAFRMQNYLFAVDSGCGFTTLLSSFGDYLRRMGVYDPEENEKRTHYIEYIVTKESDGERLGMNEVIESIMNPDEDADRNIIGLDISWFLEGSKFDELRRFLHRLYFLQDRYIFVFRIPYLEKKALDNVVSVMSDQLLLRVVPIPPLQDYVLLEYMWDSMGNLGFKSNFDFSEVFFQRITQEKKDGRFYGFKTVEKIVHEMVLKKTLYDSIRENAGETVDRAFMTAEDLPGFTKIKEEKSGYEALSELIGMEEITKRVKEIVAQVKLAQLNEKLDRPCIHMRFTGAPGTGKTTVARIVGQIFREEGILRKGAFLEYSARSLCAEYVGQTAVKTASICRDAYGSVLFLDEAYALYDNTHEMNDYGKEALTTLISEMENHRDDMLVIMAGYTDEMDTLMKGNTGLRSRMPYRIEFKNYTKKELYEIFMLMVRKHFDYTEELAAEAEKYFTSLPDEYLASREFANARFVRNLYERTWSKASLRVSLDGLDSVKLTKEDFLAACGEKEFTERLERKVKVGFN